MALLLGATGCNTCDAQSYCNSLNGYAAYDATGKLAPSKMCDVTAARGGSPGGGACGTNFHWDTSAGVCSCDAVEPCDGFGSYSWANCHFTASNGSGGSGGGGTGGGGTGSGGSNGTGGGGSSGGGGSGGGGGGGTGGGSSGGAGGGCTSGTSCGGTISGCGSGPPKLICLCPATCECTAGQPSCVGGSYECWCNGPTNGMTCANQADCCCSNGVASCVAGGC